MILKARIPCLVRAAVAAAACVHRESDYVSDARVRVVLSHYVTSRCALFSGPIVTLPKRQQNVNVLKKGAKRMSERWTGGESEMKGIAFPLDFSQLTASSRSFPAVDPASSSLPTIRQRLNQIRHFSSSLFRWVVVSLSLRSILISTSRSFNSLPPVCHLFSGHPLLLAFSSSCSCALPHLSG